MDLRRIFANAIARRVAYVVVAIALAWLGLGDARAQAYPVCGNSPITCTLPQAEAAVNVENGNAMCRSVYGNDPDFTHSTWVNTVTDPPAFQVRTYYMCHFTWGGPINGGWAAYYYRVPDCASAPPIAMGGAAAPGTSDSFCSEACVYECSGASVTLTIDGQTMTSCGAPWTANGAVCGVATPNPVTVPSDADGDGSSDDNDLSPNNPGESGDGSGQDDSRACGGQGQPACAEDGSNAGSGNGNTSGGGGNCQTPPTSSGDAILAQIAFQTWATRCALEANANEGDGSGDGPGEGDGEQPEWTKGNAPDPATDDTDYVADQTDFDLPVSTDMLDQENIFGAASCPNFTIRVWTATVNSAEWDHWCRLVAILRGFILIFGAFTAIQILLGKW